MPPGLAGYGCRAHGTCADGQVWGDEMNATHWLFGGLGRDQVVGADLAPADTRGEEFVEATEEEAAALAAVPAEFRWEAAQGERWAPSAPYADWLGRQVGA